LSVTQVTVSSSGQERFRAGAIQSCH